MDLDELGKLVNEKHAETQKEIAALGDKVDGLALNQRTIQTKLDENVATRVGCLQAQQKCKDEVHAAIRRVGVWNKIGTFIATVASALAGYLLLKGRGE